MRFILILLSLSLLTGCVDGRTKRATSAARVATDIAKKEFEAAPTPQAKNEIAQDHFNRITPILHVVDDYTHGRKPSDTKP